MIKIVAIIPFLFFALADIQAPDDEGMVKCWEGRLSLYGNEPFVRVALITDDQQRWFLEMDNDEIKTLWHDNRGRIRITGTPVTKHFQGEARDFIKVKRHEWLDDECE